MGFKFRKSIKIAPGIKLNIGKKSAGISIGGKTGGISFNTKTGARARVSAPGTGLSYSTKIGGRKSTASKTKKENIDNAAFARQLKIFDDSIKFIMTTKNPETFFGRYDDAIRAAYAMDAMTDKPIVHGEPPQATIDALNTQRTDIINAFLDRLAEDITTKASALTRGRGHRLDSFYSITAKYEDKMTPESISYRDKIYRDMKESMK